MCPASLQGADRSRQVYQLKQGTDVGYGLPNASVTDITSSLAEPYFKATRRLIGELKVNTGNYLGFPLKYKVFDKYNSSTAKKEP